MVLLRSEYPPVITACFSVSDWLKLLNDNNQEGGHDGNSLGCVVFVDPTKTKRSQIIVFINKKEISSRKWDPPEDICVHEIIHVVQFIETYINERLSPEAEAYLTEDLYSQLINAYRKAK